MHQRAEKCKLHDILIKNQLHPLGTFQNFRSLEEDA